MAAAASSSGSGSGSVTCYSPSSSPTTTITTGIYQFKITLKDSKPPIWRRIQVPSHYNFRQFHNSIQVAMGWHSVNLNYHLHKFEFKNERKEIGIKSDFERRESFRNGMPMLFFGVPKVEELDEKNELISDHFTLIKKKALYEYDFGDGWEHIILLEKILPAVDGKKYPVCVAGKRACPPEDVGGIYGYYEFLEIMENPNHPEYNLKKEWVESEFGYESDPAKFIPSEVDFTELDFPQYDLD